MGGALRVAMLVGKSDLHDTRVRKEAETLAAAGYDVRVLSLAEADRPRLEIAAGVTYERLHLRALRPKAWRPRRSADVLTSGTADASPLRRVKRGLGRQGALWMRAVGWHLKFSATVARPLRDFDPHVVHAHDLLTLYAGRRHARLRRVSLVYDSHEFERDSRRYQSAHQRVVSRLVERHAIRGTNAVVTVSPAISTELARIYRIPPPAVVLNSPPLGAVRAPVPFSLRAACGLARDDRLVAFAGSLSSQRGIEATIEAFTLLPESFHLGLMGPRKRRIEARFLALIARLGLEGRVHLVDPVRGEIVAAVIASADVAVVPQGKIARSQDLTLPTKLFDAVMAGLPIAAARTTSMAAVVRGHELGALFEIDRPASIAWAIRDVVDRPPPGISDLKRLARLQQEISWERQGDVLLELYLRLAGHQHDARRRRIEAVRS